MTITTKTIYLKGELLEITTCSLEPQFLYWFRFYRKLRKLGYDKASAQYFMSQAKHANSLVESLRYETPSETLARVRRSFK